MGLGRRVEEPGAEMKLQTVSFRTPDPVASLRVRARACSCVRVCVCVKRLHSSVCMQVSHTQYHCETIQGIQVQSSI